MADVSFHHGTRVFEDPNTAVAVRTVQSAVVALIGTAPAADAAAFPLNEPVLIKGFEDNDLAAKLGVDGTLPDALDAVRDQIGTYVYLIRIADGVDLINNAVGSSIALTGVHALKRVEPKYGRNLIPRLVAAPGLTTSLSSNGVATVTIAAGGEDYSDATTLTVTGGGGSGAELRPIITAGAITGAVIIKPGTGYTSAPTVAIADAEGSGASITVAVGMVGNPVAHELVAILEELRAVAFIDGPAESDEAAVAFAKRYGSDRLYVVAPGGMVWDTDLSGYRAMPLSAHFCGVQAKVDREIGFYASVSNKPINGVDQAQRPIRYGLQTNYLNENRVGTIVNFDAGWRTFGNRSTSPVSAWAFLNVRRTADFINIGLERALMEFIDRIPSEANLATMSATCQAFMDRMKAEGYILGGEAWLDESKNRSADTSQGRWSISVKFEPAAPMEDIRILTYREPIYYDLLVDGITNSIASGALSGGKRA